MNEQALNETARLFSDLKERFPFLDDSALTQLMLASSIGQAATALQEFKWAELETCLRKALFGEDAHYDSSVANVDVGVNLHNWPPLRVNPDDSPFHLKVYNGEKERAEIRAAAEARTRQAERDADVPF